MTSTPRWSGRRDTGSVDLPLTLEEEYGAFLDTVPDAMIIVGVQGFISLVNAPAARLFGYAHSELTGEHLSKLIPEFWRAPGGHLLPALSDVAGLAMASALEHLGVRKDGTEFPIELTLGLLQMGRSPATSLAIRDIRGRSGMRFGAEVLADRLANGVESIQDAFALFDSDGRLIHCNTGYCQLGGWLSGAIIGKSYEELLAAWISHMDFAGDAERAFFRAHRLAQRRRNDTTAFDVRMKDGRSLRAIDRPTSGGDTVETIWDLTDQARLAEGLREARKVAEGANRAKSEFVSSMSHELRTPLNAILGFAQLLQRDKREPLSPRHRERVEHILKGGEHLLRLIDDILDLSRIEAQSVSITPEPIDVLVLLDELMATLAPMAAGQMVSLELDACRTPESIAWGDRTRFAQILMNFGSNAIKYNRTHGKVTFAVSTPRPGYVRTTVRDTGIGIPADKRDKLFQAFQRAGQETGPVEGTGIGLFITKRLAQIMNGDVGFTSAFAQGSEFWVDMPIPESRTVASVPPALSSAGPGFLAGHRRKLILNIEDNPPNVTFIQDLLSTFENIALLTAGTAEEGVALARTRQPDVVVMDLNLPGMSGLDALRVLRSMPETMRIPVIALTAAASEADKLQGLSAGFDRYLTKPLNVEDFVTTLEALFCEAS